ncbi:RhuM family protein [Methylobacter sp. sgz302048]|uniref:RhuM family protein n=1 Tax=Methylobacter sp. sgz302048 TaxID=3455945 RepID=UPI003F9F7304
MNVKAVVDMFGGQTALAALIGKGQSTVAYWVKAESIPARWHPKLLMLALEKGINLSAQDFIEQPVTKQDYQIPIEAELVSKQEISKTIQLENEVYREDSPFLFYAADDGTIKVQVLLGDETVWASQKGISEIFDTTRENITIHLKNIFESKELDEKTVCKEFLLPANDGKNYRTKMYNLDVIISAGYRVNSVRATQFRRWATTILKDFLIKGFVLNDDRLKQGNQLFGKDYFDDLLEKIREIRASERRFYQKITDIYAQCSIDYDKNSPITQKFYAHVQDKLHYAIHGHTSAELIKIRADSTKPYMGLQTWKNEGKGGKITKLDVTVGKNYLTKDEVDNLNRLVSMYLDWAENFARRHKPMTMKDWAEKLDGFLEFNAYDILTAYGKTRRENAELHAIREYEKYRIVQDREYKSDFDKVVDQIKINKKLST